MEERNGGGSFVIGFLIGAIAGAAAALLLTPQSGEEMRRTIGQKSGELKDEATQAGSSKARHRRQGPGRVRSGKGPGCDQRERTQGAGHGHRQQAGE